MSFDMILGKLGWVYIDIQAEINRGIRQSLRKFMNSEPQVRCLMGSLRPESPMPRRAYYLTILRFGVIHLSPCAACKATVFSVLGVWMICAQLLIQYR